MRSASMGKFCLTTPTRSRSISLHAALNEENRGMVTARHLAMIRDGALLVNTARAGLIDNEALLRELGKGRFEAVLDVYEQEPL